MSRPNLRIGILGGGGILGSHARGFRAGAALADPVVVAEPNAARHARIHELLGPQVQIVPDYRQVIASPDIDAVDIILPHDLHMPATLEAARAGKHVLVEKVMARNIHECDRMIDACDQARVTLTICHDRRYASGWMALHDVVKSGLLGEILFWKLDHNQDVTWPEGHWARSVDGLGGGAIMSCLTHQIDALRWMGGEVEQVACLSKAHPSRMQGEFAGVVVATMQSGALAELSINWWTRSHRGANALWYELVQVCGTRGEAYTMSDRGTFIRLHGDHDAAAVAKYGRAAGEEFTPVPCGNWSGHERCLVEWFKAIRGEPAQIVTDGRTCRGTVEVAEAAYLARDTGQTQRLPLTPRPWVERSPRDPSILPAAEASYHIQHAQGARE
jgi:predicted dehydrogenase